MMNLQILQFDVEVAEARLAFTNAEANLAAARNRLLRAERAANELWRKVVNQSPQERAVPHD